MARSVPGPVAARETREAIQRSVTTRMKSEHANTSESYASPVDTLYGVLVSVEGWLEVGIDQARREDHGTMRMVLWHAILAILGRFEVEVLNTL